MLLNSLVDREAAHEHTNATVLALDFDEAQITTESQTINAQPSNELESTLKYNN